MNLYTCLTPSHESLLQCHFLPSVPPNLKVTTRRFDQPIINEQSGERSSGTYGKIGFSKVCKLKIIYLRQCIEKEIETGGEPFIFSDVDVRFYGPIAESALRGLDNHDIAFQHDGPGGHCTGFMIVRPNHRIINLFDQVLSVMYQIDVDDQTATETILNQSAHDWIYLPKAQFWTIGQTGRLWSPGQPVDPPSTLLMHHANWTVGLDNKNVLLELVRTKMTARTLCP